MEAIKEIRERMRAVQERHHARGGDGTMKEEREASAELKKLRAEASALVTEGANPCPRCGEMPHGMLQYRGEGKEVLTEYEIGCLVCKPFEHKDGTWRSAETRRNPSPTQAVLLWNAGPDMWRVVPAPEGAKPKKVKP